MDKEELLSLINKKYGIVPAGVIEHNDDEVYISCVPDSFGKLCLGLHQELVSPVMSMFARETDKGFTIYCAFLGIKYKKWFIVTMDIGKNDPKFNTIAKNIYSANLFEREMKEMFGIEPVDNPDGRRLRLHDEVWPRGSYPLRKDFQPPKEKGKLGDYPFVRVEGEGIYEVPVGPVHAGIIGPGHFRFSVAGEPIINLEIRLGFVHRGIEKLMEGKTIKEALSVSECVAGDSSIAHSWAFLSAIEKISGSRIPDRALHIRAVLLELERLYCHAADIGGIALDVGFSQPAALASIIKESIHQLNEKVIGSRFLKGVLVPGGVSKDITPDIKKTILYDLYVISQDFKELKLILNGSTSFLDRVDTTGMLKKATAEDFGVLGVAGRASGIDIDLRRDMPGIYHDIKLNIPTAQSGDVLARLNIRLEEFEGSIGLIKELLERMSLGGSIQPDIKIGEGYALGAVEGWRGPVLYWISTDKQGRIDRCKIVDPSFRSWQGLSYAVLDNIIPDFPVCNKSFDLSYPGGDL